MKKIIFMGRAAPIPAGALAANTDDPEVVRRVSRLLHPMEELSRPEAAAVLLSALVLMATTLSLWHLPL